MSTYPRERTQWTDKIIASGAPANWRAAPGPIMGVSTETAPNSGVFVPRYAEVGSDSIAASGEPPPPGTAGSWWLLVCGLWPVKESGKLVAACRSESAIVLLERKVIGGYERHAAYVLDVGKAAAVRVVLRGTDQGHDITVVIGQNSFVHTVQAGGADALGDPAPVGPEQTPFVNAVKAYAQSKFLSLVTAS